MSAFVQTSSSFQEMRRGVLRTEAGNVLVCNKPNARPQRRKLSAFQFGVCHVNRAPGAASNTHAYNSSPSDSKTSISLPDCETRGLATGTPRPDKYCT